MVYLKLYESFTQKTLQDRSDVRDKYLSDLKNLTKKYLDELKDYMHEISDAFPFISTEFIDSEYFFDFVVYPDDLEQLKENFHQGIFDRIMDDYPGTKIEFKVAFNPIVPGGRTLYSNIILEADTIPDYIEKVFEEVGPLPIQATRDGVCQFKFAHVKIFIK